jgi:plastocyanin
MRLLRFAASLMLVAPALVVVAPAEASETVRVYMVNGSFCNSLTCVQQSEDTTIHAGDTVEWIFADPACFVFDAVFGQSLCYHDATAVDGSFASGQMPVGGVSFQHTFASPGEYAYVCTLHAPIVGMQAKIVVV